MKVNKVDTFSGHRDCVYTLDTSKSNSIFYSAGADGFVIEWNLNKPDLGKLIARATTPVYAVAYEPTHDELWIGQNFEGIRVVNPYSMEDVASYGGVKSSIFDIVFTKTDAYIAQGDGVILVMDIATKSVRKRIKIADKSVRSLAINHEKNQLAAGTSDWTVLILDLENHEPIHLLKTHSNSVFVVKYSPDNRFLLTAGRDAHFHVFEVASGYKQVNDIAAHMFAINDLVYNNEGTLFATCSMDKSVKVWDAHTFRLLKVIDRARHAGHGTSINKLLWNTQGDLLVSASDDKFVAVWQIEK